MWVYLFSVAAQQIPTNLATSNNTFIISVSVCQNSEHGLSGFFCFRVSLGYNPGLGQGCVLIRGSTEGKSVSKLIFRLLNRIYFLAATELMENCFFKARMREREAVESHVHIHIHKHIQHYTYTYTYT